VSERLVFDIGTRCYAAPDRASAVKRPIPVGTNFLVRREQQGDGTTWYFIDQGNSMSCWLPGASTVEVDYRQSELAYLKMLDRMIERRDVRFEGYVEVDNLLADYAAQGSSRGQRITASGLLQFHRLLMLEHALSAPGAPRDYRIEGEPLKKAWMLDHPGLIAYDEPGGSWYMRAQPYWDLYERNKQASWADDLAWVAATRYVGGDECYSDCILGKIIDRPLQYWTRLPTGAHVADAIQRGSELAKIAADQACEKNPANLPDQPSESPVPHALVEQIRNSLTDVARPAKLDILNSLDEAERKCGREK
jgi:hypothetical protein